MKIKINVHDRGKTYSVTKEIPNKDHLDTQLKFRSNVFKDKTKYNRKEKHKNKRGEECNE